LARRIDPSFKGKPTRELNKRVFAERDFRRCVTLGNAE